MSDIKLIKEPKLEAKHKAFDYQTQAAIAIRDLPYGAIFHEQGLGKDRKSVV